MIPAITHQTAPSCALSSEQAILRGRMIEFNPGWDHRFYTDVDCRDLIRRAFPGLLATYDGYPTAIQRTDLFRVTAVYLFGGVYLDLDMDCQAPLAQLAPYGCVLAEEKTLSPLQADALGHAERLRIANYMFASAAGHPFWLDVMEAMVERAARPVLSDNDVLESTGPGLLSTVYTRVGRAYPDIMLLAHPGRTCPRCGGQSCRFGDIAQHRHHGSWRARHASAAVPRSADPGLARRALDVLRRHGQLAPHAYVLQCYGDDPVDGLSSVQALVKPLGSLVADSRSLAGKKVVVAGIPFLYEERLSSANCNILYTTFESSVLPPHWVGSINRHYHHVIVPHDRVRDVFAASGVTAPISVVGQGFNRLPRIGTETGSEAARVGFLGVPVRRKNLEGLYLACSALRPRWPGLRLVVHVATWYDWLDRRPWDALRMDPLVAWSEGRMSAEALGAWYRSLTCYAYPSRAEGWSFTPRESLFLEVPTIVSDIAIHRELVASGHCHVVPNRGGEPARFEGGVFGDWERIDVGDIAMVLEQVLSDPAAARRRAQAGAEWIEQRWLNSEAQHQLARIVAAL
jgi:glycosyltransferase involved in cell wall biosynthesis